MKKRKSHKLKTTVLDLFVSSRLPLWFMLFVFTGLFTAAQIPPRQKKIQTTYSIGDVARRDIKAPWDFFVEDPGMTNKKIAQAKKQVKMVYDLNTDLLPVTRTKIEEAFSLGRAFFSASDPPGHETAISFSANMGDNREEIPKPDFENVLESKAEFESILGIALNDRSYEILYQEKFDPHVSEKIARIMETVLKNGVVSNREILLKQEGKGIVLRDIHSNKETMITSLGNFHDPDQARRIAQTIASPMVQDADSQLAYVIADICQQLIQPNITLNRKETEQRIQKAAAEVTRAVFPVKAGQMIIREGELVDKTTLIKLAALQEHQSAQHQDPMSFMGIFLLTFSLILVFYLLFLKDHHNLKKHHNKHICFLFFILIFYLGLTQLMIYLSRSVVHSPGWDIAASSFFMLIPIPSASMLVCIFLGFDIAAGISILISILTSIGFGGNFFVLIFYFLSGVTSAHWVEDQQKRRNLIGAGFKLGIFNTLLAASFWLYSPDHAVPAALLQHEIMAFCGGLLSAILTLGLSPMIEIGFNYTTETRLLEISNLDQPLIKRLMIEAPGTYNHSLIVGTLAEAAGSAIGASGLMAKVMGYYHDIGKLDKPLYFVENQSDGKNRHDKLSPSMSALILIQHVKKGVELARQYRLGSEVIEGIVQHHGTSLIKYFYAKSLKTASGNVNEADFRYPGPKPQTREAGIVMLADVAEASVRALERPTASRIKGRVKALINDIFADGQLEECELTLKDLHAIAKSFNTILTSIYHNRIEYPDKSQEKKNGTRDTDKQSPRTENSNSAPVQKDKTDLKRLGL